MKTKTCVQCNNEFEIRPIINGVRKDYRHRTLCLDCKPLDEKISDGMSINSKLRLENKKQCSKCEEIKDFSNFYKGESCCKKCWDKRQKKRKNFLYQSLKSDLFCSVCGYDKCIEALEFHHIDPTQKDYYISYLVEKGSVNKLKEELKKCIVLCSNCHRELHYNERQNEIE